jgi:hypothetical protein
MCGYKASLPPRMLFDATTSAQRQAALAALRQYCLRKASRLERRSSRSLAATPPRPFSISSEPV